LKDCLDYYRTNIAPAQKTSLLHPGGSVPRVFYGNEKQNGRNLPSPPSNFSCNPEMPGHLAVATTTVGAFQPSLLEAQQLPAASQFTFATKQQGQIGQQQQQPGVVSPSMSTTSAPISALPQQQQQLSYSSSPFAPVKIHPDNAAGAFLASASSPVLPQPTILPPRVIFDLMSSPLDVSLPAPLMPVPASDGVISERTESSFMIMQGDAAYRDSPQNFTDTEEMHSTQTTSNISDESTTEISLSSLPASVTAQSPRPAAAVAPIMQTNMSDNFATDLTTPVTNITPLRHANPSAVQKAMVCFQ
uniref:Flocculation protein FLO11-like n=1 Tax=Gongylonema pulchrum TaxID=637853 RepID=A0A183EQV6_9BILA